MILLFLQLSQGGSKAEKRLTELQDSSELISASACIRKSIGKQADTSDDAFIFAFVEHNASTIDFSMVAEAHLDKEPFCKFLDDVLWEFILEFIRLGGTP